jgi:DNA-binding XRE family transcriptional regulator
MALTVLLFTDRSGFHASWSAACESAGLFAVQQPPDAAATALSRGTLAVFDAGTQGYDEDELLAWVGLARSLGALPAVALSGEGQLSTIEDLLVELCGGLIARSEADVPRVCSGLARRADAEREARFEYLAVSPRGGELLAIVGGEQAVLLPRPLSEEDDGSEVEAIELAEDASGAEIVLTGGKRLRLSAGDLPDRGDLNARSVNSEVPASLGDVDGVRLGQRLRALRLAAGLTQAELARRTGIHRPNIARVEAGRHTPSLETLARLAAAIGVPTTRVLAG